MKAIMKVICTKDWKRENVKKGTIVSVDDNREIIYRGEFLCEVGSAYFDVYFEIYNEISEKIFDALGLEEGKVYNGGCNTYRIKNGVLECKLLGDWETSLNNFQQVIDTDFVEIEVPFEERIENGDKYYFISTTPRLDLNYTTYDGNDFDKGLIKINNFFERAEDAEKALDEVSVILVGSIKKRRV
jgi:hypothetical protein